MKYGNRYMNSRKTNGRERGNKLGISLFKIVLKTIGIKGAYLLLKFVALYYLIFDKEAINQTMPYIIRRFPRDSKIKRYYRIYKIFLSFGEQIIDRYIYLKNKNFFEFELKTTPKIVEEVLNNNSTGAIIVTSHIGNWQIGLGAVKFLDSKKVNILMNRGRDSVVENEMRYGEDSKNIKVVNSDKFLGGIIELSSALQKNEVVIIMGDRSYGAKSLKIDFLGDKAYFPITPFQLSYTLQTPILFLYVIKSSIRKYSVYISLLSDRKDIKKRISKEKLIENQLKEYILELEKFIMKFPYQCFIFYDIWDKNINNQNQYNK